MDIKNNSGLRLPERTAAPGDSFLTTPKAVESWIQGLPTANVTETSRQIFKALVEFNRLEVNDVSRLKVAELFDKPVWYISQNLRKSYSDARFPLSAKARRTAVLNRELYAELAISYKIYIQQTISGKPRRFGRNLLITAIHRAMQGLYRVLYHAASIYDPYPPHTWNEIYWLYSYAEQHQFLDVPIEEENVRQKGSTISLLFRQILLFAIHTPYRLRQSEMDLIDEKLPEWTDKTVLGPADFRSDSEALFIVNLNGDSPPTRISALAEPADKNCRGLDIGKYFQFLRDEQDRIQTAEGASGHTNANDLTWGQLPGKFLQLLSQTPDRKFVRTQLNFELPVTVGLSTIHHLLSAESGPGTDNGESYGNGNYQLGRRDSTPPMAPPRYTATDTPDFSLIPMGQEVDGAMHVITQRENNDYGADTPPVWTKATPEKSQESVVLKTCNESAGGYCIEWSGPETPGIKVGEILGIQSTRNKGRFSIGKCQWIRNVPSQGLQIGMQIASPTSSAVTLQLMETDSDMGSVEKGLLLPELKSLGQGATVVVSALSFKVGDHLWLREVSGERQIRLTRLLESSGAFAQFLFLDMNRRTERTQHPGNY